MPVELARPQPGRNEELLPTWVRHDIPNGDTIFTSSKPGEPCVPLIIGKGYQHLLPAILKRIDPLFTGLSEKEYDRHAKDLYRSHDSEADFSLVSKEALGEEQLPIAIKVLNPSSGLGYMAATYIYTAFRTLEERGLLCVPIIAATPNILITAWNFEDLPPDYKDPEWKKFDDQITGIERELRSESEQFSTPGALSEDWHHEWLLDTSRYNYRRNPLGQTDLHSHTTMDPVFGRQSSAPMNPGGTEIALDQDALTSRIIHERIVSNLQESRRKPE